MLRQRLLLLLLALLLLLLLLPSPAEPEPRGRRSRHRQRKIKQKESAYSPAVAKPKVFEAEIDDDDDSSVFKMLNATYQGGGRKKKRKPKFFPIFSVVTFKNDPCASTSSTTTGSGNVRNGTCFTSTECEDKGGSASGNCASGFGTCCVFEVKNGTAVSENCTYVQNPSFPSAETSSSAVSYTVNKCSDDVCFLRLDFETFVIQGAGGTAVNDEGVCLDTFVVTTSTSQMVPTICGTNTGNHMYVDIGLNSGDTATLAFTFAGTTASRTWDIKVSQVECSNAASPPDTCLQYHTGLTGRIETFNYAATGDNHLNNQEYNVCVRPEAGFCCVQYSLCGDQTAALAMSLSAGPATTSLNDDSCLTYDHVTIAESSDVCSRSGSGTARGVNSRYCGPFLNFVTGLTQNGVICDCTPPFAVGIYTDNSADPQTATGAANAIQSRGLCLEYTQVAC